MQLDLFGLSEFYDTPAPTPPVTAPPRRLTRPPHLCQHVGQKDGWTRATEGQYTGMWVHMDPACLKPAYLPEEIPWPAS